MILIRWWQQHDLNERMPLNMISMQLNKSASRDQCCIEDNVDGDCGDGDGGDGEYNGWSQVSLWLSERPQFWLFWMELKNRKIRVECE